MAGPRFGYPDVMAGQTRNWAGNYVFGAAEVRRPETVESVQELVAGLKRVRPLGTRHSFNAIADTDGDLISTTGLNRIVGLENDRVTVEAGVRYGDLCTWLDARGMALHNLASLPQFGGDLNAWVGGRQRKPCDLGVGDRRGPRGWRADFAQAG
jgi:FAD/FMN-containing dehydrogenase